MDADPILFGTQHHHPAKEVFPPTFTEHFGEAVRSEALFCLQDDPSGRLQVGAPPLIRAGAAYADPLPQALVLTAIVIGFGMTAYLAILALRSLAESGSDHVDAVSTEDARQ